SFKGRRQTIKLVEPDKPVKARIDADRMRMVLENIIDNASKYTPEKGSILVTIKGTKDKVKVIVKDTGVGIPKEDQGRLFEKFYRIQNKITQNVTGSGLGLYWANKIVVLHGGEIKVQSTPGKGSTFSLILPKDGVDA